MHRKMLNGEWTCSTSTWLSWILKHGCHAVYLTLRYIMALLILFPSLSCRSRYPKRYVVDLDRPPDERWNEVVHDHVDLIPSFMETTQRLVPRLFLRVLFFIGEHLNRFLPREYAEEIRGIARESGLPLGSIVMLNILYDIFAFDREKFYEMGCTSILVDDNEGSILHGRNLDYNIPQMRNVTIFVDFVRLQGKQKKIVYSGITFAMSVILHTGQNEAFSLSLNTRYTGPYVYNIIMQILTQFRTPVGFLIRDVLSSSKNYSDAIDVLSTRPLFSPSYITIGGRKKGEGAIISRSRLRADDVLSLSDDRWYLVETNYDHWKEFEDRRMNVSIRMLEGIGRDGITIDTMLFILRSYPVKSSVTLFSTVMDVRFPSIMRYMTYVWS
ncbi:linear amide C-N hydrolase, choloylglycine hydrolase family protein [Dictyocaulus viviparus]|uniref:N-acylethanolamine-hydrolyzing acid amidase n=1 Tax=Dictyocaulus viviparus TaxID=29172 RepID=A0A0D8Y3B5_DICVI|nr:linear amide C-N hydrolase, choloylglycine hydrolase family protein [Dictyocaulus viviparus]